MPHIIIDQSDKTIIVSVTEYLETDTTGNVNPDISPLIQVSSSKQLTALQRRQLTKDKHNKTLRELKDAGVIFNSGMDSWSLQTLTVNQALNRGWAMCDQDNLEPASFEKIRNSLRSMGYIDEDFALVPEFSTQAPLSSYDQRVLRENNKYLYSKKCTRTAEYLQAFTSKSDLEQQHRWAAEEFVSPYDPTDRQSYAVTVIQDAEDGQDRTVMIHLNNMAPVNTQTVEGESFTVEVTRAVYSPTNSNWCDQESSVIFEVTNLQEAVEKLEEMYAPKPSQALGR